MATKKLDEPPSIVEVDKAEKDRLRTCAEDRLESELAEPV